MRNRNKPRKKRHLDASRNRLNRHVRKLVRHYGGHEQLQEDRHRSALPHATRKRIARTIDIPSFEGWITYETDRFYFIIAPKGGCGNVAVCDVVDFGGDKVSVLPNKHRQSIEQDAKRIFTIIRDGAKQTRVDPTRGVSFRSTRLGVVYRIKKSAPPCWGSELAEKTWETAIAFYRRFHLHLGDPDHQHQEKIAPFFEGKILDCGLILKK